MRSAAKVLAWFIGIIVLIYIILTLVASRVINPKTYKTLVENAVYKFTGHQMVINGKFEWSVFPNPSIKITDVLIKNQKGSQNVSPYFAKVQEADVQVKLVPLFSGDIVPKTIILRGAHINLVYQSAQHNPVTKSPAHTPEVSKNNPMLRMHDGNALKPPGNQHSQMAYLKHMSLPNVTILDTYINLINLKNNSITQFKDVNLTIHPRENAAFIKGNVTITHQKQTLELTLSTTLTNNVSHTQYTFEKLKFNGIAKNNAVTNTLDYAGPIQIDLSAQTLSIPHYTLIWNKLPMSGAITSNWTRNNNGLSATFKASTQVADGSINEKGAYAAPYNGVDTLHYLVSIHHINLAQLMKALHYDALLKGTGNLTATLSASNTNHNWISNLNGTGNFKLTNTELGNLNASNYLNQAMQVLHAKPIQNTGVTVFSAITGSFSIHDGVFYNDDLKMNAKELTSTGSGNINLTNQKINYHIFIKPIDKQDYTIPLMIQGDLRKPKVTIDLENLSKTLIQQSVKKGLFKKLFNDKHIDLKKIF